MHSTQLSRSLFFIRGANDNQAESELDAGCWAPSTGSICMPSMPLYAQHTCLAPGQISNMSSQGVITTPPPGWVGWVSKFRVPDAGAIIATEDIMVFMFDKTNIGCQQVMAKRELWEN